MKFLESIQTQVFHLFAIFVLHLENFRDFYQFKSSWFNLGGQKFSHSVVFEEGTIRRVARGKTGYRVN